MGDAEVTAFLSYLAVERSTGSDRNAGADGLACDVVPEGEVLVTLHDQARFEEFCDWVEQV